MRVGQFIVVVVVVFGDVDRYYVFYDRLNLNQRFK